MRVSVDLRTYFLGFSGIPQETRLLFKLVSETPGLEVGGLLVNPTDGH